METISHIAKATGAKEFTVLPKCDYWMIGNCLVIEALDLSSDTITK
jgi:hypothetical protein